MHRSSSSFLRFSCGVLLLGTGTMAPHALADAAGSGSVEFASCARQFSTVTLEKAVAKPGRSVTVPVVFQPAEGWLIKAQSATTLRLFPPAGISTPQPLMKAQDAVLNEQRGHFNVVLTSEEAGQKTIPGALTFMVCTSNGSACEPQIAKLSIELTVQ